MAKGGYSVGIGSETKAFRDGVKTGILDPLVDANKKLADLGTNNGPEQLERAMEDAQRQTAKVKREVEETADAINRGFRDAYRKAKEASDDGTKRMKENVGEFKNEAVQNLSEVASSFNGDITQMADGVQGLTGGLAASLTPGLGIPVAILGAAAGAFLASWLDASEQTEERVKGMYDDMLESQRRYLSESYIEQELAKIGQGADDAVISLDDANRLASDLGISTQTVMRAMAGDQDAITAAVEATNTKRDTELAAIRRSQEGIEQQQARVDGVNVAADELAAKFRGVTDMTNRAADAAATVNAAYSTGNDRLDATIRKLQDAAAAADELGRKNPLVTLRVDDSALEAALTRQQGRTISVNVDGQITRIGNQVW